MTILNLLNISLIRQGISLWEILLWCREFPYDYLLEISVVAQGISVWSYKFYAKNKTLHFSTNSW